MNKWNLSSSFYHEATVNTLWSYYIYQCPTGSYLSVRQTTYWKIAARPLFLRRNHSTFQPAPNSVQHMDVLRLPGICHVSLHIAPHSIWPNWPIHMTTSVWMGIIWMKFFAKRMRFHLQSSTYRRPFSVANASVIHWQWNYVNRWPDAPRSFEWLQTNRMPQLVYIWSIGQLMVAEERKFNRICLDMELFGTSRLTVQYTWLSQSEQ